MKERDNFSNRFGAQVALTGSAVGLGNLWRFPYLVGQNGGAAFIIIYVCLVFVICLPIMLSEMVVGRRSKTNAFGAFKVLAPHTKWNLIGIFAVLSAVTVLSFYCVVGGWSVAYLVKAVTFQFTGAASGAASFTQVFNSFVSAPFSPLVYTLIFMLLTGLVVILGISGGIEKFSKLMMPLLFVMIVGVAVWSFTLPGASRGVDYLFRPNFSAVTWKTVLAALGQAFFSLSLGAGTIMTYASYVKKDDDIDKLSAGTVIGDTLFAILAGCAIMPAVFSFGVSPAQGPGLVFVVLPEIFARMPLGGLFAILFFVILFLAAITSSISLMEVPTTYLMEEGHMNRKKAVAIAFGVTMALGIFCSLSQGALSSLKLFGLSIFDFFNFLSSNVLMTGGGLLLVIFIGWKLGKDAFCDEMTSGGTIRKKKWLLDWYFFAIKYLCPAAITVIFISNLLVK